MVTSAVRSCSELIATTDKGTDWSDSARRWAVTTISPMPLPSLAAAVADAGASAGTCPIAAVDASSAPSATDA